ncbi:hypothetical protein HU200_031668 [Digitaria exilis]|uniref:NAC domain-containing protein n=1 Tax=Digitaria exilis TaxID=1010633 RepID=A0A835BPH8_9POAL|nr:hypothetical protein HU200_031668 [Digitaria exilis]CAB3485075.1 unnamed protein product [Digitaria exilis]
MQKAVPPPAAGLLNEEEADDGWVLLRSGGGTTSVTAPPAHGRPPRPPPLRGARSPATGGQFEPTPDDLVGRYLPARRALRCGDLPPQIHDADVYGAHHPAFLAKLHPPANAHRPDAWFFFVCRRRGLGGKRTAGPGAYRLAGESTSNPRAAWYCHSFRYHEDSPDASASRETEWRMDEYGDRDAGERDDGAAFEMVVCKVYQRMARL